MGASPTRQPLQPEAIGAVIEVTKWLKPSISVYEQLRIRFYIHQNFPGDDFGVSKIKVMQACLNKLPYFIVRCISAFAILEYHHSDTDAPIQYIIRSESVRFP